MPSFLLSSKLRPAIDARDVVVLCQIVVTCKFGGSEALDRSRGSGLKRGLAIN